MSASGIATLRIKPPGGSWTVVGTDQARGVVPESLSASANEWGPDQLSFSVSRDSRLPWSDLLPFSEVELEVSGSGLCWSGRVSDTNLGTGNKIDVTCKGWQYALDDVMVTRAWVHQQLADWREITSFPGTLAYISDFANASVLNGRNDGYLAWGVTANTTIPIATDGARSGFYLDGGEAGAWKRVVIEWECAGNAAGIDTNLYFSDSDPSKWTGSDSGYVVVSGWGASSGTFATTLSTARRYLSLVANNKGNAPWTPAAATWFRVRRALAARDTAYEASNQSDLTANEVFTSLLSGYLPMLSSSTSRITTTSFKIPHLAYIGRPVSVRAVVQAANAYHDYLVGVSVDKELFLEQRPTSPAFEVGEWSGATFADAGDAGDELYNQVTVSGTGVDGRSLSVTRTGTHPILTAAGVTRGLTLTVDAALTTASAEAIGDAWLATRTVRPTRGSITLGGSNAVRSLTSGAPVSAASLLRHPGQRVRLSNRWDPDTGSWGRDASITQVTWRADGDEATLTLDSPRDRVDVILGRLAAVRGAGLPLA
jgi:hypothetical protein